MAADWQHFLRRWANAGLIGEAEAARIREFESTTEPARDVRWSVIAALAFGAILLAAGVLLFVSAHWDELSPAERLSVVLFQVIVFHAGGAFTASRFSALSVTLHFLGTVSLGSGIFLAGQIFNMAEHWPGGIMLWLIGAVAAWAILDQWPQGLLAALLLPTWLSGEWFVATENNRGGEDIAGVGLALLAVAYLAARATSDRRPLFRGLEIVGIVAVIPSIGDVAAYREFYRHPFDTHPAISAGMMTLGWTTAIAAPLGLAVWLRRKSAAPVFGAALWLVLLDFLARLPTENGDLTELAVYPWCLLGAVGIVAWGVAQRRKNLINLGVVAAAITVLFFYFDSLWDKLGRSESLIGLGILFLWGGWMLERLRRRLVLRIQGEAA